jgi:hypothetical protein
VKQTLNESTRLIFVKSSRLTLRHLFSSIAPIIYLLILVLGAVVIFRHISVSAYQNGFAAGTKAALDTRIPSEELEMACAGLWVGEQNKKYFNKQK